MYTVKLYWTQHNHYNPDKILEQSLRRCVALHVSLRMPSVYKDQVDCMYGFNCPIKVQLLYSAQCYAPPQLPQSAKLVF